jgi:nitroimidazol reductase NimA-like FMN-containing flavoprotein (pyridoxamine 5'-phosphate oxidase superfamily)
MGVVDGRTWLQHLSVAECWTLLSLSPVGRVGVLVDSAPEIYPVNFVVDQDTILFRTDPGSKLRGLDRSPAVCFEADGLHLDDLTGWSVLVKGRAVELHDVEELQHASSLPLRFWSIGEKAHWIRIKPTEVTGRRIVNPERRSAPTAEGELSG